MAIRFINESRSEVKTRFFDWWGALTLGGMLSALVLVLDQGSTWGWLSAGSMICYFLTFVLLGIFIKIEQKAPEPIVDLKFFKIPAFVNALLNNFIVFMGMMGGVFLLPIFAQTFLGYTATQSGYLFVPMAIAMMLASPLGGMLTGKVKSKYIIFASTLVAALGIFLFTGLDPKSTALAIIIPLSVMAFGLGFGMAQRTNIIASVVPQSEIGIASSLLALVRNISGAFGIAVNSLWPLTAIDTAAVRNLLGGEAMTRACRRPEIVADAAYAILTKPARECTGHFFIDEEVLRAEGVTDFAPYAVDPQVPLVADYFLPDAVLERTPTQLRRFL